MKYIVAVSGGVDSVVLLHMLVNNKLQAVDNEKAEVKTKFHLPNFTHQLIVAHFDHGMRSESAADAAFVKGLAESYNLEFELKAAYLGEGCSEDAARRERYNFLRQCSTKHNAPTIILAHHQDDAVETAIINLIRGTSWRGLSSLRSTVELSRPLLSFTKKQLIDYAKLHKLQWVEDASNADQSYLRNYIRHELIPKACLQDEKFLERLNKLIQVSNVQRGKIDSLLDELRQTVSLSEIYEISRYEFIMLPPVVVKELVYAVARELNPGWHPTSLQLTRSLHFGKTARIGSLLQMGDGLVMKSKKHSLEFKKY